MMIEASFLHKTKIQEIITLSTATQAFRNIKAGLSNDKNVQQRYNQNNKDLQNNYADVYAIWLRRVFQLIILCTIPVKCNLFNYFSDIHSVVPLFGITKYKTCTLK